MLWIFLLIVNLFPNDFRIHMYAIIDIETTGLSPVNEKIIEIAIYLHDGEKITDSYTTLVNPERYISAHITHLTGITNEMAENAPRFWEIAKDIVTLTENRIFVAHNASFDYNFIRSEFKSLGYNFSLNRLCTVKLSRKIIPGFKSYSLGNLCNSLNIQVTDRHRAMGDAFATVKLFELLLQKDRTLGQKTNSKFYNIEASKIANLPEETGVYYFHNQQGDIIYIGKSKDIRSRVFSHFNNESTSKSIKMADEIFDISFELTGSELVALLLESNEIKEHKPKYNRRQRRTINNTGVFKRTDDFGYITFTIEGIRDEKPIVSFNSAKEAKDRLFALTEKYNLCQKLCGLYDTSGPCFFHQIKKCNGACVQKEPVEIYNLRVQQMLDELSLAWKDFIVIDKGRNDNERALIKVANGNYIGFGYADMDYINQYPNELSDIIKKYPDNKDVQQILRTYLRQHNVEKIINFKKNY
jgi:DNA polymerase III subunit epsilon